MYKNLLISVKPEFAEKIVAKQKTIELRKCVPNVATGADIYIYATKPVSAIVGAGSVKEIIVTTPMDMWMRYSGQIKIDPTRFGQYYQGVEKAVGIKIEKTREIDPPVSLSLLRSNLFRFSPPQTYWYLRICL